MDISFFHTELFILEGKGTTRYAGQVSTNCSTNQEHNPPPHRHAHTAIICTYLRKYSDVIFDFIFPCHSKLTHHLNFAVMSSNTYVIFNYPTLPIHLVNLVNPKHFSTIWITKMNLVKGPLCHPPSVLFREPGKLYLK